MESFRRHQTFAYAPLSRVDDFLALGWYPHDSLADCRHGEYAVLVEWLCDCPCPALRPPAVQASQKDKGGHR